MTAPNPSPAPGAPADAGTAGQAPTGTQPPATGQQQPQTGQAPATQPQQGDKTDLSTLPADVRKMIEDLRSESAKHRTEKQTAAQAAQEAQQQRDKVLAALGIKADGSNADPDPDALAAQVEQAQAIAWTNAVELAVTRTALAAGADAEQLLDSRAFVDTLDAFADDDPTSPELRTKLDAHIKDYVEKHPQFKHQTQPTAPRSGTPLPPGGTGTGQQRPRSIGEALKRRLGTT